MIVSTAICVRWFFEQFLYNSFSICVIGEQTQLAGPLTLVSSTFFSCCQISFLLERIREFYLVIGNVLTVLL